MRKVSLLTSVVSGLLLLFASMAWAGEASVFDDAQGLLIRAYTVTGTGGTGLNLEVRGETGTLLDTSKVLVTGISPTGTPLPLYPATPPATVTTAEYIIHSTGLTTENISLSYDTSLRIAFVFCTDAGGLMVMKYDVQSLSPIAGQCGTPSGGPFASAPSTGLCTVGSATGTPVENTATGQWTWTCSGANGGATSSTCSALAVVAGSCGTPSGGPFASAPTTGLCSTGTATTPSLNTGAASWNWTCNGLNGGAASSTCSASASIAGTCGTADGGTYSTLSSTSPNLCSIGSVVNFAGAGPWSWNCAGPNGGANSRTCNASLQNTGTVDLDFTRSGNFVVGITTSGCTTNGQTCSVTATFVNRGTGTSAPFKVKFWISGFYMVDAYSQLLDTWNAPAIGPNQTVSHTFSGVFTGLPVHNYYYGIIAIDTDNQVAETNETNNTYSWYGIYVYR